MDELKFRRQVFTDPNSADKDFIDEKNANKDNQNLVDDMLEFDKQLSTAMNVKVPDDLAERIKLKQTLGQHILERSWNQKLFAIAASVLIVFSLVFAFLSSPKPLTTLQNDVFAHVMEEPINLNAQQHKSVADANEAIKQFGGELILASAKFNYVGNCTVGDTDGVHMVMDGEKGAVTVFLLPEAIQENASVFSNEQFDGQLIPTDKGMLAVVGNKGEALDKTAKQLVPNINWMI